MREKEIILAEILSQPSRHAEKWTTQISHDGFESWIYLDKMFPPGKVKITIETQSSKQKTKPLEREEDKPFEIINSPGFYHSSEPMQSSEETQEEN